MGRGASPSGVAVAGGVSDPAAAGGRDRSSRGDGMVPRIEPRGWTAISSGRSTTPLHLSRSRRSASPECAAKCGGSSFGASPTRCFTCSTVTRSWSWGVSTSGAALSTGPAAEAPDYGGAVSLANRILLRNRARLAKLLLRELGQKLPSTLPNALSSFRSHLLADRAKRCSH